MKAASSVYTSESGQTPKPMAGGSPGVDATLAQNSDDVLITLFQQGDRSVFRALVKRYEARIKSLLFSIFHEPDIIDDLAQEVFIKAYEGLAHFRFQSSFYTWLYRIAVNKSRDELRRRKIRRWFSLHTVLESGDHDVVSKFAVEIRDHEVEELVAAALKTLPERYRMAVILKDIDGFSYEEIAEVLRCEIGTVKSRLFRARAMLRKVLEPLLKE